LELCKRADRGIAHITAQHPPTFTHTLVPDPTLLFRYSALTFNAHAIHLDPAYCRDVEGHRNLLVHGPLSFTLLALLLRDRVKGTQTPVIESIEYRNLAPLYCGEPLKLCGREKGAGAYELWVETPEGGIAVKATAKVTQSS
jgi:hydroxyacyl-ACP dehydratase HTD2-like protein with hotdog domain